MMKILYKCTLSINNEVCSYCKTQDKSYSLNYSWAPQFEYGMAYNICLNCFRYSDVAYSHCELNGIALRAVLMIYNKIQRMPYQDNGVYIGLTGEIYESLSG